MASILKGDLTVRSRLPTTTSHTSFPKLQAGTCLPQIILSLGGFEFLKLTVEEPQLRLGLRTKAECGNVDSDPAVFHSFTLHPEREDTGRRTQETGKGGTCEMGKGWVPPFL